MLNEKVMEKEKISRCQARLLKSEKRIRYALRTEIGAIIVCVLMFIIDAWHPLIQQENLAAFLLVVLVLGVFMAYIHYVKIQWIRSVKMYRENLEDPLYQAEIPFEVKEKGGGGREDGIQGRQQGNRPPY